MVNVMLLYNTPNGWKWQWNKPHAWGGSIRTLCGVSTLYVLDLPIVNGHNKLSRDVINNGSLYHKACFIFSTHLHSKKDGRTSIACLGWEWRSFFCVIVHPMDPSHFAWQQQQQQQQIYVLELSLVTGQRKLERGSLQHDVCLILTYLKPHVTRGMAPHPMLLP